MYLLRDVFVVCVDDVPLVVLVDDEDEVVHSGRLGDLCLDGHPHRKEVGNVGRSSGIMFIINL